MEQKKLNQNMNSNLEKRLIIETEKKRRSKSKENSIRNRLRKNPQKAKTIYSANEIISNEQLKSIPEKELKICKFILEKIKKHEKSSSFRQPAIRSFQSQRDKEFYKSIIFHPQDLGHITHPIRNYAYSKNREYNMELWKTVSSRDSKLDGIQQTTFNLVSDEVECDGIRRICVNKVSVCDGFAYLDLLKKHYTLLEMR